MKALTIFLRGFSSASDKFVWAFALFSSIIVFIPHILRWHEEFIDGIILVRLQDTLESEEFRYSLIISVALASPVLLDLIIYCMSQWQSISKAVRYIWLLLLSAIVPQFIMYFLILSNEDFWIWIPAIYSSRNIAMVGGIYSLIRFYGPATFASIYSIILVVIYCLWELLRAIQLFYPSSELLIYTISVAIMIVGWVIMSILYLKWSFYIVKQYHNKLLTPDDKTCTHHLLALLALFIACLINVRQNGTDMWRQKNSTYATANTYIFTIYTLIVSIVTSERIRNQAIVESEEKTLEVKNMLIGLFSHELRTPLNTLQIGLHMLKSELVSQSVNVSGLEVMSDLEDSCNMAVDILNNLLTYQKLESGNTDVMLKSIAMKKYLENKFNEFTLVAKERGIRYNIIYKAPLINCNFNIDESKFGQALRAVISNSLDSAGKGGTVTIRVKLSSMAENSYNNNPITISFRNSTRSSVSSKVIPVIQNSFNMLEIEVTDTGPRMPATKRSRIFEDSIQFKAGVLDNDCRISLGLLISHRIIRSHNGELICSSDELTTSENGNIFIIKIPMTMIVSNDKAESETIDSPKSHRIKPGSMILRPPGHSSLASFISRASSSTDLFRNSLLATTRASFISLKDTSVKDENSLSLSRNEILSMSMTSTGTSTGSRRRGMRTFPKSMENDINNTNSNNAIITATVSSTATPIRPALFKQISDSVLLANKTSLTSSSHRTAMISNPSIHRQDSLRFRTLDNISEASSPSNSIPLNVNNTSISSRSQSLAREIRLFHGESGKSFLDIDFRRDSYYSHSNSFIMAHEEKSSEMSNLMGKDSMISVISSVLDGSNGNCNGSMHRNSIHDLSCNITTTDTTAAAAAAAATTVISCPISYPRVLMVDDANMNRKMMVRLLESNQFTVIEAVDGQEAVDKVRDAMTGNAEGLFDLILMDYQMPVMDGPTATKLIREMGYTRPIIGVTGNVLPTHIDTFLSHGANKVLPKPLNFEEFRTTLLELGFKRFT